MRPPARALRKAEIERERRALPADQSPQPLRTPRCTGISEWKGGAADTALRRTIRYGVAASGGCARAGSPARKRSQKRSERPRTRRLGCRRGPGPRRRESKRWARAVHASEACRGPVHTIGLFAVETKHPNTGNAHVETTWARLSSALMPFPPSPASREGRDGVSMKRLIAPVAIPARATGG